MAAASPLAAAVAQAPLARMDVVIVGHVDHGKSTVIGRLMADTGALPEGRLDEVRERCRRTSRPFEYAFLLDALKDEQAQGITIDAARCFFRTPRREYLVHDAPGHVEFLRNMVTGAARARAALLVIDAKHGIQENTRRHGYILSLLGIRQVAVLVNKMDLVGWDRAAFAAVEAGYRAFLGPLGVEPVRFIPVAALHGENLSLRAVAAPWYDGPTVLEQMDAFSSEDDRTRLPLRLPVQDVYKFTGRGDERRIVAGTVLAGRVRPGDAVAFQPSGKWAVVATLEGFPGPGPAEARAGQAVGLTLDRQLYVKPGELCVRADEAAPSVATRFRATLFWMGQAPLVRGRRYKLKVGADRVPVTLAEVRGVVDAGDFTARAVKPQVDRHDVAEVVLETLRPVACDPVAVDERTARFVVVDGFDIAGCGVVVETLAEGRADEEEPRRRDLGWQKSAVSPAMRRAASGHAGQVVLVTGEPTAAVDLARHLERRLFERQARTAFLAPADLHASDLADRAAVGGNDREEHLTQLGLLARAMAGCGLLFVTAVPAADRHDVERLRRLASPGDLVVVAVVDDADDAPPADLCLPAGADLDTNARAIARALVERDLIGDWSI
jgi:bifunctional enzyme CysN/CysC